MVPPMRVWIAASCVFVLLTGPVDAGRRKLCRAQCAEAVAACVEAGGKKRVCKRRLERDCRRREAVCDPTTTTTSTTVPTTTVAPVETTTTTVVTTTTTSSTTTTLLFVGDWTLTLLRQSGCVTRPAGFLWPVRIRAELDGFTRFWFVDLRPDTPSEEVCAAQLKEYIGTPGYPRNLHELRVQCPNSQMSLSFTALGPDDASARAGLGVTCAAGYSGNLERE